MKRNKFLTINAIMMLSNTAIEKAFSDVNGDTE